MSFDKIVTLYMLSPSDIRYTYVYNCRTRRGGREECRIFEDKKEKNRCEQLVRLNVSLIVMI